jgi:hypothetical protein
MTLAAPLVAGSVKEAVVPMPMLDSISICCRRVVARSSHQNAKPLEDAEQNGAYFDIFTII